MESSSSPSPRTLRSKRFSVSGGITWCLLGTFGLFNLIFDGSDLKRKEGERKRRESVRVKGERVFQYWSFNTLFNGLNVLLGITSAG